MRYVVEITGRDIPNAATDDETLLFALGRTLAFTDGPPARGGLIEWDFPSQRIDISKVGMVTSRADAGAITIANAPRDITEAGEWDHLKDWAFQKRTAILYRVPAKVWADRVAISRGVLEQPFSVLSVAGEVDAALRFPLSDARAALSAPFQTRKFLGDNVAPDGVEGDADLKGKPVPIGYGLNSNVQGVLVNKQKLIYLITGNEAAILCVRDGGIPLTAVTVRANVASMQANAPDPGFYDTCSTTSGTYVRLGAPAQYVLTFDYAEGATAADRTHAQVWQRIRTERIGTDIGDINAGSVTTVDAYDAAVAATRVQERVDGDTFTNILPFSPTPGNHLIAFAFKRDQAPVLEAGWTLIEARAQVGAEPFAALAYRKVQAGDTTTQAAFSGTGGPTDWLYAGSAMIEVAGLDDVAAYIADVQFGASTTSGAMSVSLSSETGADDALALTFGGSANAVFSGAEIMEAGSGWTNDTEVHVPSGGNAEYAASQIVATAGSTVTTTLTSTASAYGLVGVLIVLSGVAVEVGFHWPSESLASTSQADALDRVLGSLSGFEVQSLAGEWSIHRLDQPTGDPALTLVDVREDPTFAMAAGDRALTSLELARPAYAPDGSPPYKVNVRWGFNNTVMALSDFAGAAAQRLKEKFKDAWRIQTSTDVAIFDPSDGSGAFPNAPELTIDTGHQPGVDGRTCPKAQAESVRLLDLYGRLPVDTQPTASFVPVIQPDGSGDEIPPGTKVRVTYAGYGFDTGPLFVTLAADYRLNADGETVNLILGLQA